MTNTDLHRLAVETEHVMKKYAEDLDFEKAIEFREKLNEIRKILGENIIA